MHSAEFRAMNTDMVLCAEGEQAIVARGFAEAQAFIHSAEARFSRFTDTSELTALNRSAASWFSASEDLFDLVREAREFFDQTHGLFDPTILDALEIAGYDKSMDELRVQGVTPPRPGSPRATHDFRAIEFDAARHAIRLPSGMRLDLGGIAKGWTAEGATLLLADYATACATNAGGDLFTLGLPQDESAWEIELEDPRDANVTLAILRVQPGAVATSSITKRRWQQGHRVQHHVIDPRHGRPAETDWLSVTVIAPHATTAEVFAKALLIADSREAEALATERKDIAFIAVDGAGKLWGSQNARELLDDRICSVQNHQI